MKLSLTTNPSNPSLGYRPKLAFNGVGGYLLLFDELYKDGSGGFKEVGVYRFGNAATRRIDVPLPTQTSPSRWSSVRLQTQQQLFQDTGLGLFGLTPAEFKNAAVKQCENLRVSDLGTGLVECKTYSLTRVTEY